MKILGYILIIPACFFFLLAVAVYKLSEGLAFIGAKLFSVIPYPKD